MGSTGALGSNSSVGRPGERSVTQRVLSAKMHRVKQLQNQLALAHHHLSELSNENKILRVMQKKQELALRRYEDSNAELPQVLNSHSEEVRTLQTRYKQLRQQFKQTNDKLKEREMELQQLRDEHKHLLDLSKDRNLLEREKLQSLVTDLTDQVSKQNETITTLQRRLTLEAKNFKHRLQMEICKHKDTRHDLDLAINNADKLTSIIEIKERLLNNGNGKRGTAGNKKATPNVGRDVIKGARSAINVDKDDSSSDNDQLAQLCENSRYVSSALSHDDNFTSDGEQIRTRSALTSHSRTASSVTPSANTRKNSTIEDNLAKHVQEGMANMASFREDTYFDFAPVEKADKMSILKSELLSKIKNEETASRKSSANRKLSADTSIEEHNEIQRSRIQSRRNSGVSFKGGLSDEGAESKRFQPEVHMGEPWVPPEVYSIDNKVKGKSLDVYCKGIIQDIEISSRTIDQHMKEYSSSRFDSDHIEEQLQVLDQMSEFVSSDNLVKIPTDTLEELNNNFKSLGNIAGDAKPIPRKRSISCAKNSAERSSNAFGDASMSNQDLLNDLLGK